jgi:hypothetical protein
MASHVPRILATGDATVEWTFVDPHARGAGEIDMTWLVTAGNEVQALCMAGGAARAHEMIAAAAAQSDGVRPEVLGPQLPPEALTSPLDARVTRLYGLLRRFPHSASSRGQTAWRLAHVWGLQRAERPDAFLPPLPDDGVDVVAIQDIDLGYRDHPDTWYHTGRPLPDSFVLSTMAPFAGNALLDDLLQRAADRLTIIVPVMELRKTGAPIGYPLSWERTAEEVDAAVRAHPIGRAARVVVQLELSGAVLVERDTKTTLVYDPTLQEGAWMASRPGVVPGYQLCYLAALSTAFAGDATVEATGAVRRAVAATRTLHATGMIEVDGPHGGTLAYPSAAVAETLRREPADIIATYHPQVGGARSIIAGSLGGDTLLQAAEQLVVGGPESLPAGIPVETVGHWSSVDRTEIETLRSVGQVIDEYVTHYRSGEVVGRPLSVAVFGPPGAGKSFAVKETIGQKVVGGVRTLEFNLSQFEDAAELPAAFHQVRDAVLEQRLPLVFWDEFDTPLRDIRLGWLRHFLAPMQDGKFRESGRFRPLGPAIFVFAGGTAPSFAEFVAVRDAEQEKATKKPDFVSRLRGYVDILGPNRTSADDDAVVLRRALLLRSLILRNAPQIVALGDGAPQIRIDPGLLRAFLLVGTFKHGARSMEALLAMSALSGRAQFEKSSLPAPHLLELHVDATEFLALVGA